MTKIPERLLIHDIEESSKTNGPGNRFVIWVQGCSINCPGCFNPETHPFNSGKWVSLTSLLNDIIKLEDKIDGITISGGEPFDQPTALLKFCGMVKNKTKLGIIVFSGYTLDEINKIKNFSKFEESIDLLITGRFNQNNLLKQGLRGSKNKQFHFFTDLYQRHQIDNLNSGEVIIKPSGEVILTGIDPLIWENYAP